MVLLAFSRLSQTKVTVLAGELLAFSRLGEFDGRPDQLESDWVTCFPQSRRPLQPLLRGDVRLQLQQYPVPLRERHLLFVFVVLDVAAVRLWRLHRIVEILEPVVDRQLGVAAVG